MDPQRSDDAEEPNDPEQDQGVTDALVRWSKGDEAARAELFPMVYAELRRIARRYMKKEREGHTLETCALVHEAYLKLIDQTRVNWQNRSHFFGIAAQAMRRILVNHALARKTEKRGGDLQRVPLDDALRYFEEKKIDLPALDEALNRLQQIDPKQAGIVELRYFAGFTIAETAEILEISPATVSREWELARAWLFRELNKEN
jgi:RNA polymerase sigma factor (TIGR02999 family)